MKYDNFIWEETWAVFRNCSNLSVILKDFQVVRLIGRLFYYSYVMKFGIHSEQYQNNYSKEEEQKFTQVFGELTSEFAAKMAEGVHASDESVQALVKKHYDFILQFWTPNKEAYKSLAMTYILPSQYKDSYEDVAKGLGKFHYDAVCIWADKNL